MSGFQPKPNSPVHRRGLLHKGLFFGLILGPAVALSVAIVRFCVVHDKPVIMAVGVLAASVFAVDHFAYDTFCQVTVEPWGLLYRGGGLLWKRLRKTKRFPWDNYVYQATVVGDSCVSLFVADKKEYEVRHRGRSLRAASVPLVLSLNPRMSAMDDFSLFVREIREYNPDVKLEQMRSGRRLRGR